MQRKVFRTGNSTVVSLPREAIDFLRLKEGADVSVELDRENTRWLSSSNNTARRWKPCRAAKRMACITSQSSRCSFCMPA
jgi:antitoxin component of MazEF toxin-antitoxin module